MCNSRGSDNKIKPWYFNWRQVYIAWITDLYSQDITTNQHDSTYSGKKTNIIIDGEHHTALKLVGGCDGPRSPFGPNIECLERVSSFGGGILNDLEKQQTSKEMRKMKKKSFISIFESTKQIHRTKPN